MKAPRIWHWLRAHLGRYFWLPCPVCGRKFGGHEWKTGSVGSLFQAGLGGAAVCPSERCQAVAKESWRPYLEGLKK